jgi:glycerol-3-phosphate dehydrogenase (NAD(P)+)
MKLKIAVMGSGSWGTVFAQVLTDAGNEVTIWSRRQDVVDSINNQHRNPSRVSEFTLPESIKATTDPAIALVDSQIVVIALPSHAYRTNLAEWKELIPKNAVVVSLAKGVENETNMRMSEVISEVTGIESERIAVLSGPNLAHEIAQRQPTATTIACINDDNARLVQDACTTPYFRPYSTHDVIGVEIAGALKNVIALANGIAAGLGFGENSQASIITRGLHEITALGILLGAKEKTFAGLAGVGDLIATCQSPLSRNRSFGVQLAQGESVAEVLAHTTETCEAVKSCFPLLQLGRAHDLEMPITAGVVAVVHRGLEPKELLERFMTRATKREVENGG